MQSSYAHSKSSVPLSVTFRYVFHTSWNTSKISSQLNSCWVNTWMGDRLCADETSRCVTGHSGQLSLPSLQGR